MNDVFKPCLRKFILVIFYDILVYNKLWHDHLGHLEIVLQTLQSHQLCAKESKCCFGVTVLGHIISKE